MTLITQGGYEIELASILLHILIYFNLKINQFSLMLDDKQKYSTTDTNCETYERLEKDRM